MLLHGPLDNACVVERVTVDTVPEDGWVYVTGESMMHAENHPTTCDERVPAPLAAAIDICGVYCFPHGAVYWSSGPATQYRLVYRIRFDTGPVVCHESLTEVDEATVEVGTLFYLRRSGALVNGALVNGALFKLCEERKIAILMFLNEDTAVSVIWAPTQYTLEQCLRVCVALRVPTRDAHVLK